jgi:hypothetical protein
LFFFLNKHKLDVRQTLHKFDSNNKSWAHDLSASFLCLKPNHQCPFFAYKLHLYGRRRLSPPPPVTKTASLFCRLVNRNNSVGVQHISPDTS